MKYAETYGAASVRSLLKGFLTIFSVTQQHVLLIAVRSVEQISVDLPEIFYCFFDV